MAAPIEGGKQRRWEMAEDCSWTWHRYQQRQRLRQADAEAEVCGSLRSCRSCRPAAVVATYPSPCHADGVFCHFHPTFRTKFAQYFKNYDMKRRTQSCIQTAAGWAHARLSAEQSKINYYISSSSPQQPDGASPTVISYEYLCVWVFVALAQGQFSKIFVDHNERSGLITRSKGQVWPRGLPGKKINLFCVSKLPKFFKWNCKWRQQQKFTAIFMPSAICMPPLSINFQSHAEQIRLQSVLKTKPHSQ